MPPAPARRVHELRPTAVNAIMTEARGLQQQGKSLCFLMRGEPDLPTPAPIVAAAVDALRKGRTAYPNNLGEPALRQAVADKLARQNRLRYAAETEILITTGATLGIHAALAAVLNPGDEILLPGPIYDAYQSPIALVGGQAVSVPASIEQGRFQLRTEAFEAAATSRTRAMLLNTPWNPTGVVFTREELGQLVQFAAQRDLIIISDEIYEAILYDDRQHVSPAELSSDARSRTIIVQSFSKTYAMTGWRLGYCAAPAEWIAAMYLVLQQSSRGPATFVQDAGLAALTQPQDGVTAMREEYARRRRLVCDALADLPGLQVLTPEGGFFAMLDVRAWRRPSNELRRRLLHEHGVVLIHGGAYGPAGEGTLRVSFASGGQVLSAGLDRLRAALIAMR